MTRRAMTAAFSPQDEPDVVQNSVWHFDGAEILGHDAVSQNQQAIDEFAEHDVSDDYCIELR